MKLLGSTGNKITKDKMSKMCHISKWFTDQNRQPLEIEDRTN